MKLGSSRVWTLTSRSCSRARSRCRLKSRSQACHRLSTVTPAAALDALMADQVRADEANRQIVRDVLNRSEVREARCQRPGSTSSAPKQAVSTLGGAELQEIAAHARRVDAGLSGGGVDARHLDDDHHHHPARRDPDHRRGRLRP